MKPPVELVASLVQKETEQLRMSSQKMADAKPVRWNTASGLLLILANLVPLLGIVCFDWKIGELFVLYWMESAVVGIFNVARMAVIGKWAALFTGVFFIGHFGGFLAMLLGSPLLSLVLLIAIKLVADLKAHVRQHTVLPVLES